MAKSHFTKAKLHQIVILFIAFIILFGSFATYFILYTERIYPNISINRVDVSGEKTSEATTKLTDNLKMPSTLNLYYQDQTFDIKTSDIEASYNFFASVQNVYKYTRTGNFLNDFIVRFNLLLTKQNFEPVTNFDPDKLAKRLSVISGQISIDPTEPTISLANGKIQIGRGSQGIEVDQKSLESILEKELSLATPNPIPIPVVPVGNSLNDAQVQELQSRAEKYLGKSLSAKFNNSTYTLSDVDILKILDPVSGYKETEVENFIQKVSLSVNKSSQNPKFVFKGGRVTEFAPSLDGVAVKTNELKDTLIFSLDSLAQNGQDQLLIDVPVDKILPEVTTEQVNNLGIKELIGKGTSTYYHSIASRIHNVVLAASRINGTLVKPGDTFSFNDALGDVSQFTGYQQAYIISEGKTILGDGGGVCQVSTTLFRAILKAGLPVVERAAHAYRVGYYEQDSPPGFDATVYGPSPDLKFKNDTPGYILIEATANPKNYSLAFELYGTSDGRIATTTKPIVTDVAPPPDDLYQDDPTLPAGTIKQIDFKAWGGKVTFNYSVKRNGEEIYKKTFISNYRPWQAVYLRGTGPAI